MQFEGAAAHWLQSIQRKIPQATWLEFCGWIVTCFGRNQHQAFLRKLYHIHQNSTVTDYVDRFAELVDQLAAYEPHIDTLHYTTRFIDGLKHSIRSIVAIQCPIDLDTAYSLALLQEEVTEGGRSFTHRQPLQLPAPPPLLALPAPPKRPHQLPVPPPRPPVQSEFKATGENHRGQPSSSVSTDDRWAALRNYRKARGLCFTCGERWSRDHQCKGTVQLHVLQEVLELFPEESSVIEHDSSSSPLAELHLLASITELKDPSTLTFQLTGSVQNQQIQFLVDSGSTHSFINAKFAPLFTGVSDMAAPLRVKVANGEQLQCTKTLIACPWSCQGHVFTTQFKMLALGMYDGILGLDWLGMHSPMRIDWEEQWMSFEHQGSHVTLQSNNTPAYACTVVKLLLLHESSESTVQLPDDVVQILNQYASVFEEPIGLPPSRLCDHSIPLIPGAQPINKKPYHYNPQLKTEIEQQIAEMLASSVIRVSNSAFSSPIILVRKKDGSWRIVVDYCHLNAQEQVPSTHN
jgi:hypothetical protein